MSELPYPTMHVSVGGLDWDGTDPEIRIDGPYASAAETRCVVIIGKLSIVCTERTARRLHHALSIAPGLGLQP